MVEYGLLAALIAAVSVTAATNLGEENSDVFARITSAVETAGPTAPGGTPAPVVTPLVSLSLSGSTIPFSDFGGVVTIGSAIVTGGTAPFTFEVLSAVRDFDPPVTAAFFFDGADLRVDRGFTDNFDTIGEMLWETYSVSYRVTDATGAQLTSSIAVQVVP